MTKGQRYSIRADIFSLGLIGLKIIGHATIGITDNITENMRNLVEMIEEVMVIHKTERRISCEVVLTRLKQLGIAKDSISENELQLYQKKYIKNDLGYFNDSVSN